MVKESPTRNIYKSKSGTKYRIEKTWNGKHYTYGTYAKLEDAMLIRDILERIDWGFDLDPMRNIQYNPSKLHTKPWYLRKFLDGEYVYTGSFATLEEAQEERDIMEKANWDFELTNGAGEMTEEELKYGQIRYGGKFR